MLSRPMTYDMTLFLILDTVHTIWMNMMNDFFVRWSSKEMAKNFKIFRGVVTRRSNIACHSTLATSMNLHSRYLMVHTYKSIGTLLDMFECWMILLFLILMILMVFTFSKTHFGTLKGIHVSSPFDGGSIEEWRRSFSSHSAS